MAPWTPEQLAVPTSDDEISAVRGCWGGVDRRRGALSATVAMRRAWTQPDKSDYGHLRVTNMSVMTGLEIRLDDLSGEPTRALVARHLEGMHATTPAEAVFALDVDALRAEDVTFWSLWSGDDIVAMGALKILDADNGEIKSMRVVDAFLRKGAGRIMLRHILSVAHERDLKTLWLETGPTPGFAPAHGLYLSEGFEFCGPFGDYTVSPFSVFMTKRLSPGRGD